MIADIGHNFDPIQYAMQDVVLEKFKTREEDNHKVAQDFERKYSFLFKTKSQKIN